MTMLVLRPGQFSVKVLYGSESMVPVRRMGILTVCKVRKEIIFLFGDCHLIASFKALSSFPWLTPSENSMGFWIEGREKLAFLVEFANHEDLKEVHEVLKNKLENSQFSTQYFSKHGGEIGDRNEDINRNQRIVNPNDIENIKKCFDQFTLCSALEPTAKRPRLSTSLSSTTYGSLQVENPSIRSDNFTARRGMSLADFYEGVSQFTKTKEYNSMTYSQIHSASEHINTLGIDIETSGFMNLGNTCYMNSMLQGLFANAIFTKDLFKFCKMIEELGLNLDEEMPLSLVIANLASRRHRATNQLKILLLDRIRNMTYFGSTAQQDAHEFLVNILNQMQEECDKMLCKQYEVEDKQERDRKNPVTSNFAFVMESIIRCKRCNVVTKNKEESIILPVSIHMLEQAGFRCLIVFIKRYFFNASVAIKRDDKIRIPLYLTLRKGSTKETARFLAVSPTTKSINFNTAKLLKINLFRDVKKSFKHTSIDAKEVRNLSIGTVESSRTGNPEFVLKSALPSPSEAVVPEIIYTQRWRDLKVDNDVTSNNYLSSLVSRGITDDKPAMKSKMDEDDQIVHPVPVSRNNPLDHSHAQLRVSTASSGDSNPNLGSFVEALKKRIMGGQEEGKSINSKSVLDEKGDENINRAIESSTKDDAKAVLTNLTNLTIASVSRATENHEEKGTEEVDPSNKVSAAPYKLTGESSRTAVFDKRFYENTGSHGKLNAVTAAQRFMPSQKFIEVNQNYTHGLRSKISVLTPGGRSFQPESLLKLEHSTMPREQKLLNPLFTQRQSNQSRFQNPISKDDYTDEDLRFMTEEEQIMAACERSIDDQLRLFQKGNGISAKILGKADEERLSTQSANEPMKLKSPFSDINEDSKVDVEVVEETEDCSEKFEKQEGKQNIYKLLTQKSSSPDINEDIKVDVETVEEKEDSSDKSKKQKDEQSADVPISQKSPSSDINEEDIKVDVETIEEKDSSDESKKQKGEQSTGGPMSQKLHFCEINGNFFKADLEKIEKMRNYSKRFKISQDESGSSQSFNSNDAQEMAVYDYGDKFKTKEDDINLKTKRIRIKTKHESMLREHCNNTEFDDAGDAEGNGAVEEQISTVNANEETVQANDQNITRTEGENISKSSVKSVLPNADSSNSSKYKYTNLSPDNVQTNSENMGGARRKMYLKKDRPPTPPELSFRTKHVITYPGRWTSVRSSDSLINFKQTVVASKTVAPGPKLPEETPKSSSVYLPPNLTVTKPVTSLSVKSPVVGKNFKSPIEPLPSGSSDSNLESTENMDDEESSHSDLSSTDGNEIFEAFGPCSVPYKPLCCKIRRAICKYIGMDFNIDWMVQSSVQEMNIHDKPSGLVNIRGECNCLFQSLAYYVAGSEDGYELLRETIIGFEVEHPDEFADIKGWTSDRWSCHLNLLIETGLGAELELYAFAAMFCVDVWVFSTKRWLCYRPKFVIDKQYKEINIEDYRIGENEGVYLMYEHNRFSPVLIPSNGISLNKSILNSSVDNSDMNFMQEYFHPEDRKCHEEKAELLYDPTINNDEDTMGPSYRLISVVSHLGQTANSGHYICDVWCNKSESWLFCDDGSIRPISQEVVQSRSGIGYIYFYLNRELFEDE